MAHCKIYFIEAPAAGNLTGSQGRTVLEITLPYAPTFQEGSLLKLIDGGVDEANAADSTTVTHRVETLHHAFVSNNGAPVHVINVYVKPSVATDAAGMGIV